jgi:hypothetical protein
MSEHNSDLECATDSEILGADKAKRGVASRVNTHHRSSRTSLVEGEGDSGVSFRSEQNGPRQGTPELFEPKRNSPLDPFSISDT